MTEGINAGNVVTANTGKLSILFKRQYSASDDNHMSKSIEIERKYLVNILPENIQSYPHDKIEQGYIIISSDSKEVRIRHMGNRYYLTLKTGASLVRKETEIKLTRNQFDSLWPLTMGKRLEKTRYRVDYRGLIIEVDVFSRVLAGLVIAEVEFANRAECLKFKPPAWFGQEVTDNERYKNKNLAS